MKKNLLLILLLAFVYQSSSSFWIITSFYVNQQYISNNLCVNRFDAIPVCNGYCYLNTKLSEDAEKEQALPKIKNQEVQPLFFQLSQVVPSKNFLYKLPVIYPQYQCAFNRLDVLVSVFQPPEIV